MSPPGRPGSEDRSAQPAGTPASRPRGFVVALLGAESTGKTTLARQLCEVLVEQGKDAIVVSEYLREFCDAEGRTPTFPEQPRIAEEQTRRIEQAASTHAFVIADTTALMIAVYSDQVFGDRHLAASAQADHLRLCDLTLLTALDIPWQPDGLQRDGPHVREPVDAKLRAALQCAGLPYSVVHGTGAARLQAALACVQRALAPPSSEAEGAARWHWHCERCGDADCERRLLLPTIPS